MGKYCFPAYSIKILLFNLDLSRTESFFNIVYMIYYCNGEFQKSLVVVSQNKNALKLKKCRCQMSKFHEDFSNDELLSNFS